jgi:hypothetical protein
MDGLICKPNLQEEMLMEITIHQKFAKLVPRKFDLAYAVDITEKSVFGNDDDHRLESKYTSVTWVGKERCNFCEPDRFIRWLLFGVLLVKERG